MKSSDLVKLLNLPESTLRKYAQDYADYLSPAAAGRHRDYTDRDARVLRLVVEMKAQRVKPDDIDATLSSLRAGEWERLPALDVGAQSIVPTSENMITLQADKSALQREIEVLREMLDRAENRADAAAADRGELLHRIGKLEGLIELYEQGRIKPQTPAND